MDVTDDERGFGFGVVSIAGEKHIAMQLRHGLYAIKRETNGRVEYALCNDQLHILYSPATSLDDLRARFKR